MINSIEKGRKEDGSRSIADKIKGRLHDLEKTIDNNLGRWAWELLQNAKDSISDDADRDVCVHIELNNDGVIFKHNGSCFSELDIRGLINQISSKEVEEGTQTKNTGRFGTGFLTTHMLSRKVRVSSIVKAEDAKCYRFEFLLDREGKTTTELAPKVELAWAGFQKSTQEIDSGYDENLFNTSFQYTLETHEQKDIANKGIVEFLKLIPYVLTFISKIREVQIVDNVAGRSVLFRNTNEVVDEFISVIEKVENSVKSDVLILQAKASKVSIAIEVDKVEKGYLVKDIGSVPKLFCDYPLIGSEDFHFPVVVNSFYFNPLTERDGVWLKNSNDSEVQENQELLTCSVELYKNLVDGVDRGSVFDLFNLATTKVPNVSEKYFDRAWYVESIQVPLRTFLMQAEIVETNSGMVSIEEIRFPSADFHKEDRELIWQLSFDLGVNKLPIKEHIQKWAKVIWGDCSEVDIDDLVSDLKGKENMQSLAETLSVGEEESFDWINRCLKFVYEKNTTLFSGYEIVPNQFGVLRASKDLSLDEIVDEELKEIADLVGHNYCDELVHKDVFLEHHTSKRNIDDVANKITTLINGEDNSDNRKLAITKLIQWFEGNEDFGKSHFSALYNKKEKLLVDTIEDKESLFIILTSNVAIAKVADLVKQFKKDPGKIIENMSKAKELDDLLAEFGVVDVDELKMLIAATSNSEQVVISQPPLPKMEITREILSSLGVTNSKELQIAFQDEGVSEQFYHTSNPNPEMFIYAQEIIERAKDNILKYLNDHKDYDCGGVEDLAPTVMGGIAKYGQIITIVVRPSDNKQVIIYHDSEKASLEYENAELWVEDGKTAPKLLTLGNVLRNTGITKIPV